MKVGLNRVEEVPAGCGIKLLIIVTPPGLEPKIFVPREYLTDEYLDGAVKQSSSKLCHSVASLQWL